MGADELAAPPYPFPPPPVVAPPLVAPPEPVVAAPITLPTPPPASLVAPPAAPPAAVTAAAAVAVPPAPDFALLLSAPAPSPAHAPASADSPPEPSFGVRDDVPEEPNIARSTVGERIILVLAVLIPPVGLIAAIGAAIRSIDRRGWVIGVLRSAIATGAVLSVVAGIGGYLGWTALHQQQAHDRIASDSAAFCATIKADPTMLRSPTFGWPGVRATITDSLAAMQGYEDRWTTLSAVSPAGIKPDVVKVGAAAKQIIDSVAVSRTVDDSSDVSLMTQTASASGVRSWYAEYCH